ncbi:hypothetical protein GCM10011579_092610 [Streptomyces albiflavescens]|uniref:Uncharacterized protein n=1 Tax=Streptomyces albiflavescens TaxID=1623582 RepID=A0A917YES6_9ACTN|nr:hypothetical protein [Streptomyces albiflavescens]GGN93787.1 hypothetical protein GCM10011579_092610 [Streptomyces albiflavescens]
MTHLMTVLTVCSIVTAEVSALTRLWLQLRWRSRQEQARLVCLSGIAEHLAVGSQIVLDDQQSDGQRFQMKAGRDPAKEGGTAT